MLSLCPSLAQKSQYHSDNHTGRRQNPLMAPLPRKGPKLHGFLPLLPIPSSPQTRRLSSPGQGVQGLAYSDQLSGSHTREGPMKPYDTWRAIIRTNFRWAHQKWGHPFPVGLSCRPSHRGAESQLSIQPGAPWITMIVALRSCTPALS